MNKETLDVLVQAARTVFGCRHQKILVGIQSVEDMVRLEEKVNQKPCTITQADLPRVLVVGMGASLGVTAKEFSQNTALGLGETEKQCLRNLKTLRQKYEAATRAVMSLKYRDSVGVRRFVVKHNLMARSVNNIMGNSVLPDYPYEFKRERHDD